MTSHHPEFSMQRRASFDHDCMYLTIYRYLAEPTKLLVLSASQAAMTPGSVSRKRRLARPSVFVAVVGSLLLTQHVHVSTARKIVIVRRNNSNNNEQDITATSSNIDEVGGKVEGDSIDDSLFDPVEPDPSCLQDAGAAEGDNENCVNGGNEPPASTIEMEKVLIDSRFFDAYGGEDPSIIDPEYDDASADELTVEAGSSKLSDTRKGDATDVGGDQQGQCTEPKYVYRDKHWGSDKKILKMRDRLRRSGAKRPPVFLMPGLAATRLVSWKHTNCKQISNLLSDIKMQDYVWLNINMLIQMATIDPDCWIGCLSLGLNQSDPILKARRGGKDGKNNTTKTNGDMRCKLRPDEGLDAISSLAPGSVTSEFLVGGTNTVYAWLTQWLADNLGYDVTSLLGLPYDWRLSPDVMEKRDGFLTSTRYRIEAVVKSNGGIPGIMVAHSMGNVIFRYFLEWLRLEMRKETLEELMVGWERRKRSQSQAKRNQQQDASTTSTQTGSEEHRPGWVGGTPSTSTSPVPTNQSPQERITAFASGLKSGIDTFMKAYFEDDDLESSEEGRGDQDDDAQIDDDSNKNTEELQRAQLVELSMIEGDTKWLAWLHKHIWTYVGLSAPLIGAINPLRAVLSGENMGLPMSDDVARKLELSFGSTNNVVPISTKAGFCDAPDGLAGADRTKLACLEELIPEIEEAAKKHRGNKRGSKKHDPWKDFPALKHLLIDRVDWDTNFPMIQAAVEKCTPGEKEKKVKTEDIDSQCHNRSAVNFSARDAPDGYIFDQFSKIWKEKDEPLQVKRDQLLKSYWNGPVGSILNTTWDRPHIKHVVMSYGVDVATEVGYQYFKSEIIGETEKDGYDDTPSVRTVIWEEPEGKIVEEIVHDEAPKSLTDAITQKIGWGKKKSTRRVINATKPLGHSGDGTIPYLSLSWAHTWLLHATRATRHSRDTSSSSSGGAHSKDGTRISDKHALDNIVISHRPKGENEWVLGAALEKTDEICTDDDEDLDDTGTAHPHGTKYKPAMIRYQSKGRSRSTGNDYTTAVIEAIGVEHKETTRNYDILAAVFSDVLKNLHDDYPELV